MSAGLDEFQPAPQAPLYARFPRRFRGIAGERQVKYTIGTIWLIVNAVCIGLGWRGYLPGARRSVAA